MAYTPTNWVDGVTPLDAAHMNHLETGVAALAVPGIRQVTGGDVHIEFGSAVCPGGSDVAVTFSEPFSSPPVVVGSLSGGGVCVFEPQSITTIGFTIHIDALAPVGSPTATWIAIGAG